tara:strand:+ start:35 stop:1090 length:1056 start_codon:yes stop_codon:yes gene_type:complete
MEFFNKKEEVLDVQLTEYGKYLLSQGRLKPAFYAFYDEEILYDVAKVASSNEGVRVEPPKDADRRIRYETPNLKPQSNTTGVETRVRQFQKAVETNMNKKALSVNSINFADAFENIPQFGQKFFVATDPLGTSALTSEYAPAWGVNMLSNEISASQDYYTVNLTSSAAARNNGVIKEIPQIDIVVDYNMFYTTDSQSKNKFKVMTNANNKGINIAVKEDYILIDLQEHNTTYEKENFFCEVYVSGSDEGLRQLNYQDSSLAAATKDDVGYFLNFLCDFDIPIDTAIIYGINERAITHNDGLTPGMTEGTTAAFERAEMEGDLYGSGPGPAGTGPGGEGDWMGIEADDEEPC